MVVQRKNKSNMKKKVSKSMKSRSNRRSRSSQRGGSPASDLVNQAANSPPVRDDFVTSPRIRDGPMAEPYGGQCGGSDASDMVMEKLANTSTTNKFPEGMNVNGNMESLNLYQPSGGSRKSRKSHKSRKSLKGGKKGKTNKNKKNGKNRTKSKNTNSKRRMMKGGGSDWMSSQYSLGSYNAAEASVAPFSQSAAASRNDYMNPPTLGLAGSGAPMGALEGANVRMVGSPLV
jgi:hypothetical protein